MNKKVQEFRSMDSKALVNEIGKRRVQLIEECAALSNQGKKNSNSTGKLKKEIARLETILNEKIIESFKG